jgi:hypothetical protein
VLIERTAVLETREAVPGSVAAKAMIMTMFA